MKTTKSPRRPPPLILPDNSAETPEAGVTPLSSASALHASVAATELAVILQRRVTACVLLCNAVEHEMRTFYGILFRGNIMCGSMRGAFLE